MLVQRCNPVETRKVLKMVDSLVQAGIEFIPIPVHGEWTREQLSQLLVQQLAELEAKASANETTTC